MTLPNKDNPMTTNNPVRAWLLRVFPDLPPKDLAAFEASMSGDEPYVLGPDSLHKEGVPQGEVVQRHWSGKRAFPGTERDYWLYIPRQYHSASPASLMVFQDGGRYMGEEAGVPAVFDNLIHEGAMPPTIGLFINSGDVGPGDPTYGGDNNRSFEYDSLGDSYAQFLIEEMIPEVAKAFTLADRPTARAICGMSSGGICAFTVAWERPDVFGKVVSHCGSFTSIRGGNSYPALIRKTAPKPLRIFLQTGARDLDTIYGNWPLANQDMAAALAYQGYDYQLVMGEGGHTLKHGAAIFPDTMRWLWRDHASL